MKGLVLLSVAIDDQLKAILSTQLSSLLGVNDSLQPECQSVIALIYYCCSFLYKERKKASSPGMTAMGLQLNGQRRTLVGIVGIIVMWMYQRLQMNALLRRWRDREEVS